MKNNRNEQVVGVDDPVRPFLLFRQVQHKTIAKITAINRIVGSSKNSAHFAFLLGYILLGSSGSCTTTAIMLTSAGFIIRQKPRFVQSSHGGSSRTPTPTGGKRAAEFCRGRPPDVPLFLYQSINIEQKNHVKEFLYVVFYICWLSYFTSSMIAVSAASPRRTPVRTMRV